MTGTTAAHVDRDAGPIRLVRDVVLLVARIGLGVLMIGHAKLTYDFAGHSIGNTGKLFEQSGVPLAQITGPLNVIGEFFGGIAMILGVAVPLVGALMTLNMIGAWVLVHTSGLYAMDHNGPELAIAIGLLSLVVAVSGSGRLGVDHFVVRWWRQRSA